MGVVLPVAIAAGGGVGHNDVHALRPAELEPQPADTPLHLPFRVLVGAAAVLCAAPQTQDTQSLDRY